MVAIIIGDIINSRKLVDQSLWLNPFKILLREYGHTPLNWEIFRGDNFQIEITDPEEALRAALKIKSLIKGIGGRDQKKRISEIDVRMAIGLGSKDFAASRISESNGEVFINAGEKFEKLKKEKLTLAVQSPWRMFDYEMNLYIKLAALQMDNWTISSAELFYNLLENDSITQAEIGQRLGIEQHSVSRRMSRANVDVILEMEKMYKSKLKQYLK